MEPGLTELGNKLYQAVTFQTSHNTVLTQLLVGFFINNFLINTCYFYYENQ